jgi:hypothetical protein
VKQADFEYRIVLVELYIGLWVLEILCSFRLMGIGSGVDDYTSGIL